MKRRYFISSQFVDNYVQYWFVDGNYVFYKQKNGEILPSTHTLGTLLTMDRMREVVEEEIALLI